MSKKLNANGKYILFKTVEPEIDGMKSKLIISPDTLNPSLLYGEVLSTGDECLSLYNGDFVYVNKINAIKLTHLNEDYYISKEDDIFVYISDEKDEELANE